MDAPGAAHQPHMNGNPSLRHPNTMGGNGIPSNSYPSSNLPQPGFQTSPFQFNSLPYPQDTARTSSMQQHQPGGASQPDGMFASSYPPGAETSGAPNGSGLDYGARAHSTGMWRASSTNSGGMTLAAELLGVPLPDEYSAKVNLQQCCSVRGQDDSACCGTSSQLFPCSTCAVDLARRDAASA